MSVADVPLTFDGKSQKKPLELLKLIVALQRPSNAKTSAGPSVQHIIDELWPDLEAKDPQGSFDITLHRLRKLIGVEDAVILADGHISLNLALVRWDVASFEALAVSDKPGDAFCAIQSYAGPLLGSAQYSWLTAPRERLTLLYLKVVEKCAFQLEADNDYQGAISLYERALLQDNLTETFYRGLMRCHAALGETIEALRAYRRCKELLWVVLSASPTTETESLKARIVI